MSKPSISTFVPKIHPEGVLFVLIAGFIALLLSFIHTNLAWIGVVLTAWVAYFFRDPQRVTPVGEGLVISPADGIVVGIGTVTPPADLQLDGKDWTKISIFLNVFDVHINRVPIAGTILSSKYHKGKFLNASLDKASDENERQSLTVKTSSGATVGFVQIAGLIARRIRCDIKEGDVVLSGQRFGLIRFGSRMDVYLPKGVASQVVVGQRMIAGETVLADLTSKQEKRVGEIR